MDIDMPGIDGFDTTKEIIKLFHDMSEKEKPVIIGCSAYQDDDQVQKSKEVGMQFYVTKPPPKKDIEKIFKKNFAQYLNTNQDFE